MSVKVRLGEAGVILHVVRDLDGDPVTGQAGSIVATAFEPDGSTSALSVTAAEIGTTGWYTLTFTPDQLGAWRVHATGDAALGRAVPDGANPATVDYQVNVHATGIETTGNLMTTRDVVKRRLGLEDSEFDTLLDDILAEVSAYMQDEIDHAILQATYTDYLDGTGGDTLFLRNGPLVSVTTLHSVAYSDGGAGARAETLTAVDEAIRVEGGLRSEGHLGRGWIRLLNGGTFTPGRRNYRAVYVGGFAAVPAMLSHAAVVECVRQFNIREVHGLRSKSTGDDNVEPAPPAAGDAALMRAMRPYMQRGVG